MTAETTRYYHTRMQRVLDYIDAHLDENLSVETLSAVAAFSRHHFHRQFSALFGLGVYRYVQLMRLKRASYRLAFRDIDPVLNIALDSFYDGPEAFARAFKQRMGQTPSAFREQPCWESWHAAYAPLETVRSFQMQHAFTADQVRIIDFPATRIALLDHRGDPARIGDSIRRFIAWRKANGLTPKTSATFNIFHVDPDDTPSDDYRLGLCAATDRAITPNDAGIDASLIPANRCATLRVTGDSDNLRPAIGFLYRDWLEASGEEPGNFPIFVQRVSFFPDVPEHEAITDVFLPLRPARQDE